MRERLPAASAGFAQACHAVTGGNPFLLGALLTQLVADGVAPDDEAAARLGTFGSEQVARVVERQLARLPDGAGVAGTRRRRPRPGAALRHAAGLARLELAAAARAADALRAAGLLEDGPRADARASADRGNAVREPAARASGRSGTRTPPRCSRASAPTPSASGCTCCAPSRRATRPPSRRCATRRDGPARAALPQSAAAYLRRALAEPPPDAAEDADVRLELGLALAAYMQPDACTTCCTRRSPPPPRRTSAARSP